MQRRSVTVFAAIVIVGLAVAGAFVPEGLVAGAEGRPERLEVRPVLPAQPALDYDLAVPGGAHFYTQTDGQGGATGTGYAVSNADAIPFWDFFRAAGGVEAVGYPVSHRFVWHGFVVQAFQKVVFQWRPEVGTVYYVNVLDEMHERGLDPWLVTVRQTPPLADWSADTGLPWEEIQARHLALLNGNPAIAAAYFAEEDTIHRNGLPMAPIQDMGGVLVLRAQRKIYQQWLGEVPWARAGEVVTANGGDVGKEAGLYPPSAVTPQPSSSVPLSVVGEGPAVPPPTTGPSYPGVSIRVSTERSLYALGEPVQATIFNEGRTVSFGLMGYRCSPFSLEQLGPSGWELVPGPPVACIAILLILRPGESRTFTVDAPPTPGVYRLGLRVNVEGTDARHVTYTDPFTVR